MHGREWNGSPYSARILRLTFVCWAFFSLPAISWAGPDKGRICIQMLSRAQPVPVETILPSAVNAVLARAFGGRLPTPAEVASRPIDIEPEMLESAPPRFIPRRSLKRFLESVRDPKMYHHRVVGFENITTFIKILADPPRAPALPRRSRQIVGALPSLITLATFSATPWLPLVTAEILDVVGVGGLVAQIVMGFRYYDARSAPWHDRLAELLKNFENKKERDEVLLSDFRFRVRQAELTDFVDRSKLEPTHLEIQNSPTERGFLDFTGARLLDFVRSKPSVTLNFWSILYFDSKRGEPVLIYGIPR